MIERIKKWWNTPKRKVIKCPVCESVFSDRTESPKEIWKSKPTDKRQVRIAYAFFFGSLATLLIGYWVFYAYFFDPIHSGELVRLLSFLALTWFSVGLGAVFLYLISKTSYHANRGFANTHRGR